MELVRASGEILTASMPIIYTGAGIATGLLAIIGCLYRWNGISIFIRHKILRRPQFNYHLLFRNYLEKFRNIEDHQDLFSEILAVTSKLISASGASLVIREPSGNFKMCAAHGLAPFSFDMKEIKGFLSWLEKKRVVVTREQLVSLRAYQEVKSEGLRYCVQFNAEACVPLFLGDKLYGILNVGSRKAGHYDREACDMLYSLAIYFTSVIRRVDLSRELTRKNSELKQTVQLRNHIITNLSHELRTPLNSIIGLSEVLSTESENSLGEDQKTYASMIHKSGTRLLKSINTMVDLSKIQSNRLELNVQRLNLRRLLAEAGQSVKFNKRTHFELSVNGDTPHIFGDEVRLCQVFRHLLDNAAKFTKHGKVTVDATKCGEMLKIRIADTGIGIPDDKKEEILNGFYQVDNGMAREYEGLGLGLLVSRKIVELHGGRLWFASKMGYGSSFYVTLPLKPICVKHQEINLS